MPHIDSWLWQGPGLPGGYRGINKRQPNLLIIQVAYGKFPLRARIQKCLGLGGGMQYHPSGESTELALELYSLREGGLIRMLFITQCLRWASSTGGILLGSFLHCM